MELTMLVKIDKGNQDKGGNLSCLHYYYIAFALFIHLLFLL